MTRRKRTLIQAELCEHCDCLVSIPEIVAEWPEWWGPEGIESCCFCGMEALIVVAQA